MKDKDRGRHGSPGPATENESVTTNQPGDPKNVGKSVQREGQNVKKGERPKGGSTGRDSTGIDPKDPIDPDSPHLIPS